MNSGRQKPLKSIVPLHNIFKRFLTSILMIKGEKSMKGMMQKELCRINYKSGVSKEKLLTPKERTVLILSSKEDPIIACVPVASAVKRYKGMHGTLINCIKFNS